MTLFISLNNELIQQLRTLIPSTFKTYYNNFFSFSEYIKTDADFIITEIKCLEDSSDYLLYPHRKMIILGSENEDIKKLHPFLKNSVKYFPHQYEMNDVYHYILQQYHYNKKKNSENFLNSNNLIGSSKTTQSLKQQINQYGPAEETVTILGESGTGKEVVAKSLHDISKRNGNFVPKNCCAIPDMLLEAELFGSVKGAFTDSINRKGLFEKAHNGTLFLDEIGDISFSMQSKILRAVETKMITPLGSTEDKKIDTRIITATSRNLKEMISEGKFRKDLYYRINTLIIHILPLRERKGDIPELCDFFLNKRKIRKQLNHKALEKLLDYDWPGNIRELKSTIRRAEIHSSYEKEISEEHIVFY